MNRIKINFSPKMKEESRMEEIVVTAMHFNVSTEGEDYCQSDIFLPHTVFT